MSNRAFSWCKSNPNGVMIGLVGADHVKFGNGIPARFDRLAAETDLECVQVILNPTPIGKYQKCDVSNMRIA